MAGGRPTKYKPEYCKDIIKFFSDPPYKYVEKPVKDKEGNVAMAKVKEANDLKFLIDYAEYLDVDYTTLWQWTKDHPEFSKAYKKAKQLQERKLVVNALSGLYQGSMAIFTCKNILGWRDKVEQLNINTDDEEFRNNFFGIEKDSDEG
jgi:hypothetical protein